MVYDVLFQILMCIIFSLLLAYHCSIIICVGVRRRFWSWDSGGFIDNLYVLHTPQPMSVILFIG